MSTIHKPKKAVSLEKKVQQQQKQQAKKEEEEIKKEEVKEEKKEEEFEEDDEEMNSAEDPRVVKRYEQAAQVANEAMKLAVSLCTEGAIIFDICKKVNQYIDAECAKIFKSQYTYEKGIAFPCCISLNNCCGYFSPLSDDKTAIKKGDMLKIELGAHVSGFVAETCKTIVVGEEPTGDKARVIEACYKALEECIKNLKPEVSASEVTKAIKEVCDKYNVKAIDYIVSRNMERYMIDGDKCILNAQAKQSIQEDKIEKNDVWNLDIVLTTGSARPTEKDVRTTVFKKNVDEAYILKMRTSVQIFREINNKYPTFPFTMSMLESESKAKMGIVEMTKHNLLDPYTVVFDKDGLVAQFKATVIVTEDGVKNLTPVEKPSFIAN